MSEFSRRAFLTAAAAGAAGAVFTPAAAFASPAAPGQRVQLAPAESDDVVVYQTSFEDDDPAWLTEWSSYDPSEAHTGAQSLKYVRTDSAEYGLAHVVIAAEPGRTYSLSCFVKTSGLSAGKYGARVAIDCYDANDTWISGGYSNHVRSTDWTEAKTAYVAPDNAATFHVSCYIYKGVTGTAWFDDLALTRLAPRLLHTELLTPSYRGLLIPGDYDEIALHADLDVDPADIADYSVSVTVVDESGSTVDQQDYPASASLDYTYPATTLAAGRYTVRAHAANTATGEGVGIEEWGIEKVAAAPATYIDKHGRLIRDGAPYFPLGFYDSILNGSSVLQLAGAPFNTLLTYSPPEESGLNMAANHGITVIYSLKDFFYDSTAGAKPDEIVTEADEVPVIVDRVTAYRDHPAMLAWYMADEAPFTTHGERMIAHYNAVVENDSSHPAYVVNNNIDAAAGDLMRTMDVFGSEAKPLYDDSSELGQVTDRAEAAREALVNRPFWDVPQSMAWSSVNQGRVGRFPTLAEYRNMTWQYLTEGATGLIYWEIYYMHRDPDLSFEDTMAIATAVGQEVADLVPVLLSIDAPPATTAPTTEWLNWMVKAHEGAGYLFSANRTRDPQSATFTVPAAVSVSVRGEDRSLQVAPDGSFADDFDSIAVHLYEIVLADYGSLEGVTTDYLPGATGVSASRLLQQSQAAAAAGQSAAADHLLQAYRLRVERERGRSLTDDQVQTLIRLSNHI